jgi:stearoyl-CoA desaturase (delta-9 desaturase)
VLYHTTFFINSLCHMIGSRRYETGESSKNSFIMALLTLGEGWHNNHHYYQYCARQGFRWWEIDITYYILRVLGWLRIVRDIKEPTAAVLEGRFGSGGTADARV